MTAAPPGEVAVEVRGLTKRFGSVLAVDALTFSVQPGRVTGFLGPNGAGKTTTMRVMVGLTPATSGRVTIGGHLYNDKTVFSWLRRLDRKGTNIGALCTGSHVLARAGLLEGYRCTIHWENITGFIEEFPGIEITNELFEIDRNRFTCSGGTAALDMMLNLIGRQHGHELAAAVSEQFIHERIRDQHDHQRMALTARLGVRHPKLIQVIKLMEQHLEEPLDRAALAAKVRLSTRQLERLFGKYLRRSPARYYLELRLNRARLLLLQTNMSVIDVALACGFVSASHFSKCYRDFFGKTPRKERGLPLVSGAEANSPHPPVASATGPSLSR